MRYLCMVYFDEEKLEALSQSALDALVRESLAYDDELQRKGHLIVGHALKPAKTARSVFIDDDDTVCTTEGPRAATKEQLGGFLLIQARDMDEATHAAAKIPLARLGNVEVRPILPRE
jgi:hypothetical protein